MKNNRVLAASLSTITLLASAGMCCFGYVYLPLSAERLGITFGCFIIGGLVASVLVYAVVSKLPATRTSRTTVVALFVLLGSLPLLSTAYPRITYARFGLTVFGVMPIPALDVTVDKNGVLWFRPKAHRITRDELDALVTPEVEVVVVGIGWNSVAYLTDDAKSLAADLDLRVLPTPEAFAVYNALKFKGRTVVLLAHSTC